MTGPAREAAIPERPWADRAAAAALSPPSVIGRGYRSYETYDVTIADSVVGTIQRDVLRSGHVIGVLPLDRRRDEIVLVRQFRLGAHLASDRGAVVEIVAGRVDPGETPEAAAGRECREEIGVPARLTRLFDILPAPALSDERMTLFLGEIDAEGVPDHAGDPHEQEEVRPLRIPVDDALQALARGAFASAPTIIALQWLALRRCGILALPTSQETPHAALRSDLVSNGGQP